LHGRVGDDPAAALREHLIDAAERLMAHVPFSAIRTREIAREAEVSDGVLYNYFEDKSELLLAALLRSYDRLAGRFEAALPRAGEGEVEDNLAVLLNALLELVSEAMPAMAGLMVDPELLHRLLDEVHRRPLGPQQMQARIVDYVREEQRLGRLAPGADANSIGVIMMGSAVVVSLAGHVGPTSTPEQNAARAKALVATLLSGLAPRT
jgi:AcrR family transcriptional regulator